MSASLQSTAQRAKAIYTWDEGNIAVTLDVGREDYVIYLNDQHDTTELANALRALNGWGFYMADPMDGEVIHEHGAEYVLFRKDP